MSDVSEQLQRVRNYISSLRTRLSNPLGIALLVGVPIAVWFVVGHFWGVGGGQYNLPEEVKFNRDIRPILSENCFACHGPDEAAREADLRLDTEAGAKAKREEYERPAVVPGSPGKSALVRRITHDDPEKRMPPAEMTKSGSGGKELTGRQVALLKRWVEQGAEWERWWAYTEVKRPDVPSVEGGDGELRNPIDHFIRAKLEGQGLEPSPPAGRRTLMRRLSLDLTGMPPSLDDARAFVEDSGPNAYEELVDSLLASPHFGERMAIGWLDLVRYSETKGYHSDLHQNVYPYRDYVIKSFNENKPFDQFTREQIAGDLLPNSTREQMVAAGFNRLGQTTAEGGAQPKEYLTKYAIDRVNTVSTTWLASTMECAQCHDHKYDPFTQEDFYTMAAFFGDIKERGLIPNTNELAPEKALPNREQSDSLESLSKEIAHLDKQIDRARRNDRPVSASHLQRLERLNQQRRAMKDRMAKTVVTQGVETRVVRVLPRGDWQNDTGPIVQPDVPEFLPELKVEGRAVDRLDLANWLVSRKNPLTARAFVNRMWQQFFGTGLSKRLSDFGAQGEWPSHPELLDWLAVEFMESGWDIKHTIKLMVMSATYRQSSAATDEQLNKDPNNRYLARQSRFRLPAENVRDNALAISGLLNTDVGGRSFKPYQPEGYWRDIQTFGVDDGRASSWTASKGAAQYRRGIYTYWKRSFLHPTMKALGASTRQGCIALRPETNTPLQALALLNDETFVEAARVFAYHIMEEGGSTVEERARYALERAVIRKAEEKEVDELQKLYRRHLDHFKKNVEAARHLVSVGQAAVPEDVSVSQLAAWTSVARSILNLHETLTRY